MFQVHQAGCGANRAFTMERIAAAVRTLAHCACLSCGVLMACRAPRNARRSVPCVYHGTHHISCASIAFTTEHITSAVRPLLSPRNPSHQLCVHCFHHGIRHSIYVNYNVPQKTLDGALHVITMKRIAAAVRTRAPDFPVVAAWVRSVPSQWHASQYLSVHVHLPYLWQPCSMTCP